MPVRTERAIALVLLAVATGYVVVAMGYGRQARLIPLVVGVTFWLMACLYAVTQWVPATPGWIRAVLAFNLASLSPSALKTSLDSQQGTQKHQREEASAPAMRVVVWLGAAAAAMYYLGYLVAIPIFLLLYLKLEARLSWLATVLLTAGTGGAIWLIFSMLLNVRAF